MSELPPSVIGSSRILIPAPGDGGHKEQYSHASNKALNLPACGNAVILIFS